MTVTSPPDNSHASDKPAMDDALKAISEDLATFRKDFETLKEDVATLGAAGAERVEQTLKEGIETAQEKTRETLSEAETEFDEMRRQAERAVRKNPITAVAAALALGYFVSGLMRK